MDMTKQSEDLKMRIQARKNRKGGKANKLLSAAPASGNNEADEA